MRYKSHTDGVLRLFDEKKKLFIEKNENYSCSYIKCAEILALILEDKPISLNNIDDIIKFQIITRKLDKLVRYCNLSFTDQKDKVGEKLCDTAEDDAIYSLMLAEISKPYVVEDLVIKDPLEPKKKIDIRKEIPIKKDVEIKKQEQTINENDEIEEDVDIGL